MRRAWVLNLDAEEELARAGPYRAPRSVEAAVRANLASALRLLGPGDVLVESGGIALAREAALARARSAQTSGELAQPRGELDVRAGTVDARGLPGVAWCPTPSALALLTRAGTCPEPAPSLDALRRANHRAFCAELGQELPGATFARDAGEVDAALARARPGSDWLLKRAFGVAGRGQRRVRAGEPTAADRGWIAASLESALGGLQVEPRLALEVEFALHGRVAADGELTLGAPCVQTCDGAGAWRSTRLAAAGDFERGERELLEDGARAVAAALVELGYFGPFSVDARRGRFEGERCFAARGEVNARYTLGWPIGMAAGAKLR